MQHGMEYPPAVNELIESGDPRAKVVGKRRPPAAGSEALKAAAALNLLATQLGRIRNSGCRLSCHRASNPLQKLQF